MSQVRRNKDEALLAYLLGFGCHYMLDSACHPYVNRMAEEGVIPHIVLEKEFDRVLMEEPAEIRIIIIQPVVLCQGWNMPE